MTKETYDKIQSFSPYVVVVTSIVALLAFTANILGII